MENNLDTNLPQLFYDNTQGKDGKCEVLIDYWLSWTFRCAEQKYSERNPTVHEYARKMLLFLVFGGNETNGAYRSDSSNNMDKTIETVEVWKQHRYIDLWVHVTFADGEKHALVIENKYYTHLREGQLERYKETAELYYKNHPEYRVKYFFLTAHDYMHQHDAEICKANGFCFATIGELKEVIGDKPTGNALFDEFWFNWY